MKIHIKYSGVFLMITLTCLRANAFQIDRHLNPINNRQNINNNDNEARLLLTAQPDFTADASCVNYENITGCGFGESVKSVKKGDSYRHESGTVIDYFVPGKLLTWTNIQISFCKYYRMPNTSGERKNESLHISERNFEFGKRTSLLSLEIKRKN